MLIPKRIEKKKLILYFVIIGAMICGTGFFLYKKSSISVKQVPEALEAPSYENIEQIGSDELDIEQVEIKNGNKIFDTEIFSDPKFRILKDTTVKTTEKIPTGKKNPFEAY